MIKKTALYNDGPVKKGLEYRIETRKYYHFALVKGKPFYAYLWVFPTGFVSYSKESAIK